MDNSEDETTHENEQERSSNSYDHSDYDRVDSDEDKDEEFMIGRVTARKESYDSHDKVPQHQQEVVDVTFNFDFSLAILEM